MPWEIIVSCIVGIFIGWFLHSFTGRRYTIGEALQRKILRNQREQLQAALGNEEVRAMIEAKKQKKLDEEQYIKDCIIAEICPLCQSQIKVEVDDVFDTWRCTSGLCGWAKVEY